MKIGRAEAAVGTGNTAEAMLSGSLPVFATPALVALMEQAACDALEGALEAGVTTVGTQISVEHLSATPAGMRVWAEARLTGREGRTYAFEIEARDEAGPIGRASHTRVAVRSERFMQRAREKLQK